MAFLDFDIREVFFLAVRLILAGACALIRWRPSVAHVCDCQRVVTNTVFDPPALHHFVRNF